MVWLPSAARLVTAIGSASASIGNVQKAAMQTIALRMVEAPWDNLTPIVTRRPLPGYEYHAVRL